jgi:hypothetical protein
MKKSLTVLFALILIACYSCKEKIDVNKEKEAILNLLQKEGDLFVANDLQNIFAIHIQDSTATRLEHGTDSYNIYKGWDEIKNLYEEYVKRNTADSSYKNPKNFKENIIIKVVGNSAWVLCDNTWKYIYNNVPEENTNIQISFFEKVGGEWKFSFNAFIQKPVVIPKVEVSK